jgi:hypothetical protein
LSISLLRVVQVVVVMAQALLAVAVEVLAVFVLEQVLA